MKTLKLAWGVPARARVAKRWRPSPSFSIDVALRHTRQNYLATFCKFVGIYNNNRVRLVHTNTIFICIGTEECMISMLQLHHGRREIFMVGVVGVGFLTFDGDGFARIARGDAHSH